MRRALINGLLSNPKDAFAGDAAGVRGLAPVGVFIPDQNDGIERIIRLAE